MNALAAAFAVSLPGATIFLIILPIQARLLLPITAGITLLSMIFAGSAAPFLPHAFGIGTGVLSTAGAQAPTPADPNADALRRYSAALRLTETPRNRFEYKFLAVEKASVDRGRVPAPRVTREELVVSPRDAGLIESATRQQSSARPP